MTRPSVCPICLVRETSIIQYQLLCHKCWPGVRTYEDHAKQLQYRFIFMEAMRQGIPAVSHAMSYAPKV